ncbi:MAG: DUF2085 domain-containing protein [Thermoplasmata archaeon]
MSKREQARCVPAKPCNHGNGNPTLQEQPESGTRTIMKHRILESRVLLVLFAFSFFATLSIFLVPFLIPPGTVTNLNGSANSIDYNELWEALPFFPRIVYYAGDAECHQISNRTIYLNGNQMPVCARDTSIFLFLTVGLFLGMLSRRNYYISAGLLSILPRKFGMFIERRIGAKWFTTIFVFVCLAPVAIDGGLQLLTEYESTNLLRVITGFPAGLVAGLLLAIMIKSFKATKEYERD